MKEETILNISCNKTYEVLETFCNYPIFSDFYKNEKVKFQFFLKIVENIEKVKLQTIETIKVMAEITVNNYKGQQKWIAAKEEQLNHVCETFKQVASKQVNNNIDYIIFKQENN